MDAATYLISFLLTQTRADDIRISIVRSDTGPNLRTSVGAWYFDSPIAHPGDGEGVRRALVKNLEYAMGECCSGFDWNDEEEG